MAEKIPSSRVCRDDITAVILAGGEGRRAGYRDKGTLLWRGKPLVAHVCERLAPQVGQILISCNRNAAFYTAYAESTFPDLRDGYEGPMAGLEAAAALVNTDWVLVAPCDTPQLPDDLVARMLPVILSAGLEGCYARSAGRDHYLCALLMRSSLESVSSYLDGGGRAVRHWYAQHSVGVVDFGENSEAFTNINEL